MIFPTTIFPVQIPSPVISIQKKYQGNLANPPLLGVEQYGVVRSHGSHHVPLPPALEHDGEGDSAREGEDLRQAVVEPEQHGRDGARRSDVAICPDALGERQEEALGLRRGEGRLAPTLWCL